MASWERIALIREGRIDELEKEVKKLKKMLKASMKQVNLKDQRIDMFEKKVFKLRKEIGKTL